MTNDASGAVTDPGLAILADHAGRAVARQAVKLDEHRARAATLFTAASVAGGFLGAETFKPPSVPGNWAWAGAILFALAGLDLAFVMLPRRWGFHIDADEALKKKKLENMSLDAVNNDLTEGLIKMYKHNEKRLKHLTLALALMVLFTTGTVVAFLANLAFR